MKTSQWVPRTFLTASVDHAFADGILGKYGFSRAAYLGRFALIFRDPETGEPEGESEGSTNLYQLYVNLQMQLESLQHEESPFLVTKLQTLRKLERLLVQQNQFLVGAPNRQEEARPSDGEQVIREPLVHELFNRYVQKTANPGRLGTQVFVERIMALSRGMQDVVQPQAATERMLVFQQGVSLGAEQESRGRAQERAVVSAGDTGQQVHRMVAQQAEQVDVETLQRVTQEVVREMVPERVEERQPVQQKRSASFVQLTDEFVQRLRQDGLVKPGREEKQSGQSQLTRTKQGSLADVVQQVVDRARQTGMTGVVQDGSTQVRRDVGRRTTQEIVHRSRQEDIAGTVQDVTERVTREDLTRVVQELEQRTMREDLTRAVQELVQRTMRADFSRELQEVVTRTKREDMASAVQE
ncbi:MAG: hypothetical protein ACXVOI_03260, partial [Tumebacillaceae bacterium]